jgi:hypothetical protein
MKTPLLLLAKLTAFAVLTGVTVADDDEVIPTAYGKERYAAMTKKSPFVLATPPAAAEAPKEANFTDNMFVKGVGMGFVVVQRAGDDHPIRLWDDQKDADTNIFVKEVKWSDKPGATRVVLEQNGKIGEVGFNENELKAAAAAPPPPPGGNRGPMPPGVPGSQRPPASAAMQNYQKNNAGAIAVPRPAVQSSVQVPRPNNMAAQPAANANFNASRTGNGTVNRYAPQATQATQAAQAAQGNDANSGRRRIREIRN